MKIRYHNTMKDFFAFAKFHVTRTFEGRRHFTTKVSRMVAGSFAGLLFLDIVFGSYSYLSLTHLVLLCVLFLVTVYLVSCLMVKRQVARTNMGMHGFPAHKGFIGLHELEIADDVLVGRTGAAECRTPWSSVLAVCAAQGHTFVYLNAATAYVLPESAVIEGDYPGFVAELRGRVRRHRLD